MGNYVCGPIFSSLFTRGESEDKGVQIVQSAILTKSKIIGGIGTNFIQLISPQDWNQINNTLNDLLLFVCEEYMLIYAKYTNTSQMTQIDNISLPVSDCTYYPYTYINSSAVKLMSNCLGLLQLSFSTPMLTLNYNNTTNVITYTLEMINVSESLRNIHTIVLENNNTLVIGIL